MNDLGIKRTVELQNLEKVPRDDDTTIVVRDQQKKRKLAGLFKMSRNKITGATTHTEVRPYEQDQRGHIVDEENGKKKTSESTKEAEATQKGQSRKF